MKALNILLPSLIVAIISCSGGKTTPIPPNVIMIVADDMNGYGTFGQCSFC